MVPTNALLTYQNAIDCICIYQRIVLVHIKGAFVSVANEHFNTTVVFVSICYQFMCSIIWHQLLETSKRQNGYTTGYYVK